MGLEHAGEHGNAPVGLGIREVRAADGVGHRAFRPEGSLWVGNAEQAGVLGQERHGALVLVRPGSRSRRRRRASRDGGLESGFEADEARSAGPGMEADVLGAAGLRLQALEPGGIKRLRATLLRQGIAGEEKNRREECCGGKDSWASRHLAPRWQPGYGGSRHTRDAYSPPCSLLRRSGVYPRGNRKARTASYAQTSTSRP